jgi:mRNA deadenylase 3'-5' endonuclease subunit Ccr4
VAPDQSFRETTQGELSVVTFNMLAPFYNSLAIDDWQQREAFAKEDRATRVPLAVQMAKQANGDILCLQEVEGGPELEPILAKLLAEPYGDTQGYDSFLWAPLMPKRIGDVVGLCVAWRSQRHRVSTVLAIYCVCSLCFAGSFTTDSSFLVSFHLFLLTLLSWWHPTVSREA